MHKRSLALNETTSSVFFRSLYRVRHLFYTSAILIFCANGLMADTLIFANGDRLTGQFLKEENNIIYFQSDILGEIEVAKDTATLEIAEEPTPAPAPTPLPVVEPEPPPTKQTKSQTLTKFIAILSSVESLYPLQKWQSSLSLGYTLQNGELDSRDLALRFESKRETDKNNLRLNFRYDYGLQIKDGVKSISTDRNSAGLRWRYNLSDKLFTQTNSRYLKDQVKDIDLEFQQSGGVGWRFLDRERTKASITPSVTYRAQNIRGVENESEFLTTMFQDFTFDINSRVSFAEEFDFSVNPSDTSVFTYDILTKLEVELTQKIKLDFRWEYDFDNQLAAGIDREQQKVIFGLGYKF